MPDNDLDLDRRLARLARSLDEAAPPLPVDEIIARAGKVRRRPLAGSTPPRLLVAAGAMAATVAAAVGVTVLFDRDGSRPADVVAGPPTTPSAGPTTPAVTGVERADASGPVTLERSLPATGVLSVAGPDDGGALVLLDFSGSQVGRGSPGGWYTNDPDRGVDVVSTDTGAIVVREAPPLRDPVPGCAAVHGGGGLRVAAGCGDPEVRVVSADGTSTPLTGAAGAVGHWRYAIASPDGAWVLAQWSAECELPVAYLVDARTGERSAVVSETAHSTALGWAPDGRAVVSTAGGACGDTAWEAGTYLVDPDSDTRTRISPLQSSALFTDRRQYVANRIERMIDQATAELGFAREGCGEPDHGGENVFTCFTFEGHAIEVSARPVAEVIDEPGSGRLRVVCGSVSYTFGEFDISRPPAGLLERASAALLSRLYCTLED